MVIESLPMPNNNDTLDGIVTMVIAKVYNKTNRSVELVVLLLEKTRGDLDVLNTVPLNNDIIAMVKAISGNNCNVGRWKTLPGGDVGGEVLRELLSL